MADNLNDRGPEDRSRINMNEEWEVSYWTNELGCTKSELQTAVEKVGNSADSVRNYLSGK